MQLQKDVERLRAERSSVERRLSGLPPGSNTAKSILRGRELCIVDQYKTEAKYVFAKPEHYKQPLEATWRAKEKREVNRGETITWTELCMYGLHEDAAPLIHNAFSMRRVPGRLVPVVSSSRLGVTHMHA